ncbi:MAG: hypothetical protein OXB91_00630 [Bryobacterales bacterium]|nr:hypothetical protein [Bryobacterales bacterium]
MKTHRFVIAYLDDFGGSVRLDIWFAHQGHRQNGAWQRWRFC